MPIFHIDLAAPDAHLQLLAIMCWPKDPQARENFLLVSAGSTIQTVEDGLTRCAERLATLPDGVPGEMAEARGTRVALIANIIGADVRAEIEARHFRPHGGLSGLLHAPEMRAILRSAETTGGKLGAACGELLSYVAMMHRHHPELGPSLNRAVHVMVHTAQHEHRRIPAERDRKTMWQSWGGTAPLWTARALAAAGSRGVRRIPVQKIIQYAHWLADFALGFKHEKARAPLLTEAEVVWVNSELQPLEPFIPPLTEMQVGWARNYPS
jgi:hypothetical protein